MTTTLKGVSSDCVPVSITESSWSSDETCLAPASSDPNRRMRRAIFVLIHEYGWVLGQDGNLYSSNPVETAWGERVA